MVEKNVTVDRIADFFQMLDSTLDGPMEILLIGGGAMAVRGEKVATKDIDLVVPDKNDYSLLLEALGRIGFRPPDRLDRPYKMMRTNIFIHEEGYWIDTFCDNICERFLVHSGIMKRAEKYLELEKVAVLVMSREDIFLSKSVTERVGDLDDMHEMFIRGLDEEVILDEVHFQTDRSSGGTIWEAFLVSKLDDLEERFGIRVPFKAEVEKRANRELERILKSQI